MKAINHAKAWKAATMLNGEEVPKKTADHNS